LVIGDSSNIIKHTCCLTKPKDDKLERIILRIFKEANRYDMFEFYHMSRTQNRQVDLLANEASHLEVQILRTKGETFISPIP